MFGRKRSERQIIQAMGEASATLRAALGDTALYDGYRNRYIATGDPYQLEQMLRYVRLSDEVKR